ncbi:uncharacterized protein [Oscarella lobularis]|uniref:uncharacterized protein n=1 Tax=Oscarella lobularis TaxID=121494 RepID=UPI0033142DB7
MSAKCRHCNAKKWPTEPPGMCCAKGKVDVPLLGNPPEPLRALLTENTSLAKEFRENIRKYNSCFVMTSFQAHTLVEPGFMPTFKVQGQIYHNIGPLTPAAEQQPQFVQIYFIDDRGQQADARLSWQIDRESQLNRETILRLQDMLQENNEHVRVFKTALEQRTPTMPEYRVVLREDRVPRGEHERTFNAPSGHDVAALVPEGQEGYRDIVLSDKDDRIMRIHEVHRSYDSLQYPLLFPLGEDGYHLSRRQKNPQTNVITTKKMTMLQFYAFRLMQRDGDFNTLLRAGKLSHQFIVDVFAKIETDRLNHMRHHQDDLRAASYTTLRDAVEADGDPSNVGQLVVLPSSFTGGPRYMHEKCQDAMTYVKHHGAPDLFITMTCNSNWPEITNELLPGQTPIDRHDLVARVFRLKVQRFMYLVDTQNIYGIKRCHVYTIEWQKRGLPHVHFLSWMVEKIRPEQIDSIISAELPDPNEDPTLFATITKHMIHGPCGQLNRRSPCMKDGQCTKHYPRQFLRETVTSLNGYPLYRRRSPEDGGIETTLGRFHIDNRWVVPYSPFLSRTFDAHVNVEYCRSICALKYLMAYLNKGKDRAVVGLANRHRNDEITRYQIARYLSTNEGVWRILKFPIHDHFPAAEQLQVHLENGQRTLFNVRNAENLAQQPPATTLTGFFELCAADNFAKTLLYVDVPRYFRWENKKWMRRKQGQSLPHTPGIKKSTTLGRIYTVHPRDTECYLLRLLLLHVRGPTCFADLRTVDGAVFDTYAEACRERGLLTDDRHWHLALTEATVTDRPHKIRDMFAIMLHMCEISDPPDLWERHKEAMAQDYLRTLRRRANDETLSYTDAIFNRALTYIENKLLSFPGGKPLSEYGLATPDRSEEQSDDFPRDIAAEYSYNTPEMHERLATNERSLTPEQTRVYGELLDYVARGASNAIIFLDAPGGTGKTFLLNVFIDKIRSQGEIGLAVASSGIAATLLTGGKTAHSVFKLPLNICRYDRPTLSIQKNTARSRLLRLAKVIIWDECTMANKKALEALDRSLRDIRENDALMGGLPLILAGDFRQTLPIIPKGTKADEIAACLKYSRSLWPKVQTLRLTTNMRAHLFGDAQSGAYADLLMQIGNGEIAPDPQDGLIAVPCGTVVQSTDELLESVFPQLAERYKDIAWLGERAILAPKNDKVTELNEAMLQLIPEDEKIYLAVDTTLEPDDAVNYPTEVLNSLNPPGLPSHTLRLKVGAPIMLLRNIDAPRLCNGTKLTVTRLCPNVIEATLCTGRYAGESVFVPRIPLIPSDSTVSFKRLQFPVRLSFAMTINKSQGQTLKTVGLCLSTKCFAHGQFYVACSRVSSPNNLYVFSESPKTANVVYREVL